MKKEALNQIQHLINISELMDQKGFQKESMKSIYDAFVIAEAESYRIASEINNMTKTASRSVGESKIKELENSFVVTSSIGSSIANWLKTKGAGWLKGLGTKVKGGLGEDASTEAAEAAAKSLRGRGGSFLERAGDDLSKLKFWRNKSKIQDAIKKAEQRLMDFNAAGDIKKAERMQRHIDFLKGELSKGSLTDLGKLTAGTAAIGAAGIGGASALRGGEKRPVEEWAIGKRPLGAIDNTGAPSLSPYTPSVGGAGMKGFGPVTPPSGNNVMMPLPNIMDIEQRISNLERVVEVIRAKVGV